MYLSKISVSKTETNTQVEFEKVADDLLMISINNDTADSKTIFSYWRLVGTGANPPMEIGINTTTGKIKSITLFVDSDCFSNISCSSQNYEDGNIILDSDIFSKENDYIDIEENYSVSLDAEKFICIFCEQYETKSIIADGSIEFFLNHNDELIGFAINNLSEEEINIIKSLK